MKRSVTMIGLALAAVSGFQALAVPARPGLRSVTMPDGSVVKVRLVGDEFYHQYFTEDGYPLVQQDGYFYYSDITEGGEVVNSCIVASQPSLRSAAAQAFVQRIDMKTLEQRISNRAAKSARRLRLSEAMASGEAARKSAAKSSDSSLFDAPLYEQGYGLFPGTPFPAYGQRRALVLLVEYQDVKFNDSYAVGAKDYFTRLLNEEGFSDYGATGSAAQYFRENSGNTFLPQFDVLGPVTLSKNQSYYGGNNYAGNDKNAHLMAKEACDQLDDEVDFSVYDTNNDGLIDNVFVFYAGTGEASSGKANDVWPHSWTMSAAGLRSYEVTYDGKRLENYTCSNEWNFNYDRYGNVVAGDPGRPDGIGTFVHEFSHTMGLPDLYATSYTSSFTPGTWSVLDYGPYNNDGMTPPNYSAFERYALGWIKPRVVGDPVSARLPVITENVCAIIPTSRAKEFFLLENRQQQGWDKYIPGHGMLVWHVDYDENVWQRNVVNNTASHQYVDLVEADNTRTEASRRGDSFPGTSGKTELTGETLPALKTWSNVTLDYPITNIAESDGFIYFDVLGGSPNSIVAPAEEVQAMDVYGDKFRIGWTPREGYEAVVSVYTLPEDADVEDGETGGDTEGGDAEGDSEGSGADVEQKGGMKAVGVLSDADVTYVPGFHNRNAGSAAGILVDGLTEGVTYHYTVTMINQLNESEPIQGEPVLTKTPAGVYGIADGSDCAAWVRVDGRSINVQEGVRLSVYDLAGAKVAEGVSGVTVQAPGMYVVTLQASGKAVKVLVR